MIVTLTSGWGRSSISQSKLWEQRTVHGCAYYSQPPSTTSVSATGASTDMFKTLKHMKIPLPFPSCSGVHSLTFPSPTFACCCCFPHYPKRWWKLQNHFCPPQPDCTGTGLNWRWGLGRKEVTTLPPCCCSCSHPQLSPPLYSQAGVGRVVFEFPLPPGQKGSSSGGRQRRDDRKGGGGEYIWDEGKGRSDFHRFHRD